MEGWSGTAASPELASGLLPRKMKDTFLTRKLHSKRTREQAGTYQMHKTKSCPGCYLRFRDLHRLFSRGVPPARNKKPHLTSKKCQCAPIMMWNCSNTVLGPCKSASSMASADLFCPSWWKLELARRQKDQQPPRLCPIAEAGSASCNQDGGQGLEQSCHRSPPLSGFLGPCSLGWEWGRPGSTTWVGEKSPEEIQ